MFSLMTTLWIRLQGKRKLEEAISAQSTYKIYLPCSFEFVNKNLRRASRQKKNKKSVSLLSAKMCVVGPPRHLLNQSWLAGGRVV